jgi:hypothetical protein
VAIAEDAEFREAGDRGGSSREELETHPNAPDFTEVVRARGMDSRKGDSGGQVLVATGTA